MPKGIYCDGKDECFELSCGEGGYILTSARNKACWTVVGPGGLGSRSIWLSTTVLARG